MGLIGEPMRDYYDRRAREYDPPFGGQATEWLGRGLFAARERPGWDAEVAQLVAVLERLPPARVLDVACGTGFLTRHLRGELTALDQSPEMVAIASAALPGARVMVGDATALPFEDGSFDRMVTGHFYGHLLAGEREAFLAQARRVAPELVVVDSARGKGVEAEQWQERVLEDGSRHRVYKRYLRGEELAEELGGGAVLHDGRWFVAVVAGTP